MSSDDLFKILDGMPTTSPISDPSPFSMRRMVAKSTFLNNVGLVNRIGEVVTNVAPSLAEFLDVEPPLTETDFEALGGREIGMKYFDGVRPADIEAFKQSRLLEVLMRDASLRGASVGVSEMAVSMLTDMVYNPISWVGLLSGGLLSLGATNFFRKAISEKLFKSAFLNKLTVSALSEAATAIPFSVAQVALESQDPNRDINMAEAAKRVAADTLFAAAFGPGVVVAGEVLRGAPTIVASLKAAREGKLDPFIKYMKDRAKNIRVPKDVQDGVEEAMNNAAEASHEMYNNMGVDPEVAQTAAAYAASEDFVVDPDELIDGVKAVDEAANTAGDVEQRASAVQGAQEKTGDVTGQGSTARIKDRAAGTVTIVASQEVVDAVRTAEKSLADLISRYKDGPVDPAALSDFESIGRAIAALEDLDTLEPSIYQEMGAEFFDFVRKQIQEGAESRSFLNWYDELSPVMGSIVSLALEAPIRANPLTRWAAKALGVAQTAADIVRAHATRVWLRGVLKEGVLDNVKEILEKGVPSSKVPSAVLTRIGEVFAASASRSEKIKIGRRVLRALRNAYAESLADNPKFSLDTDFDSFVSRVDMIGVFESLADISPDVQRVILSRIAEGVEKIARKAKVVLTKTGRIRKTYWGKPHVAGDPFELASSLRSLGLLESDIKKILAEADKIGWENPSKIHDALNDIIDDVVGGEFRPVVATRSIEDFTPRETVSDTPRVTDVEEDVVQSTVEYAKENGIDLTEDMVRNAVKEADDAIAAIKRLLTECNLG